MYNGSGSLGRLDVLLAAILRAAISPPASSTMKKPFSTSPACCCAIQPISSWAGRMHRGGRDQPVSYLVLEAGPPPEHPGQCRRLRGRERRPWAADARGGDHVSRTKPASQIPGRWSDRGGLCPHGVPAGIGHGSAPTRAATGWLCPGANTP